jgi:hypothetical protein
MEYSKLKQERLSPPHPRSTKMPAVTAAQPWPLPHIDWERPRNTAGTASAGRPGSLAKTSADASPAQPAPQRSTNAKPRSPHHRQRATFLQDRENPPRNKNLKAGQISPARYVRAEWEKSNQEVQVKVRAVSSIRTIPSNKSFKQPPATPSRSLASVPVPSPLALIPAFPIPLHSPP